MRSILVSPSIVRIFVFVLALCVCAVPLLEVGVISLAGKVGDLERKREELRAEILTLHYVRRNLDRMEEKEKMLRSFFGMEKYENIEQIVGMGGDWHPDLSRRVPDASSIERGQGGLPRGATGIAEPPNLREKLEDLGSNHEILNRLVVRQERTWANTPSVIPVALKSPKISSEFGWRMNPFTNRREFHAGIDIIGPEGTRIIAPAAGRVFSCGRDRWLGNFLVVQHTGSLKTIYGHLKSLSVSEGMSVKRGDHLGIMGNTGLSTSRHLHYAVIVNGQAVDPLQFILDVRNS